MTVGWIFEGDRDRFLAAREKSFERTSTAPAFQCPFCKHTFKAKELLSAHLDSVHVMKRPFLLVSGIEPGSEDAIRAKTSFQSLELFNCTEVWIGVDGEPVRQTQRAKLAHELSKLNRASVQIRLLNVGDGLTAPVINEYRLRVIIPEEESLAKIDEIFLSELGSNDVSLDKVGSFYQVTRDDASAEYAEALADYVRAVLIKDGDPKTGVSTRLHHDSDIYNRALNTLRPFERPLAKLLCALMRFGLNDFTKWQEATGFDSLDRACSLLGPLAEFDGTTIEIGTSQSRQEHARVFVCPIDVGTDNVTRLARQAAELTRWGMAAEQYFIAVAEQMSINALDRAKIRALWAVTALRLGAGTSAQKALSLLDGDPTFGRWTASKLAGVEL
jgi:hypothetical protein